jgi:hypothetical protein
VEGDATGANRRTTPLIGLHLKGRVLHDRPRRHPAARGARARWKKARSCGGDYSSGEADQQEIY